MRTPEKPKHFTSSVVLGSVLGGVAWEAVEIAHTLAYLRELLHEPHLQQGAHLLAHIPPLALVGFGVAWALLRRKRETAITLVEPSPDMVVIMRERTTTTTTTTEREVLLRKRT